MKKVDIIISNYLSSGIGPVQTVGRIINNHNFFLENGYDITAFTLDCLSVPVYTQVKKGNGKIIKFLRNITKWLALNSKIYSRYRIGLMFKESHRILDYYKSLKRHPDILVFHSLMDVHEYLKYYKLENVKIVLFTHSDGMMFKMLLSYFPKLVGTKYEKHLHSMADFIMSNVDVKPCIAKIEEVNLLQKHPVLIGKTCLVENGIDDLTTNQLEEIKGIRSKSYDKKFRLVSAGSLNGRKGQGEIIEALGKLDKGKLNEIHVELIGEGRERLHLEQKVEEYGLTDCVTFSGYIPNKDIYKHLSANNIYILISKLEGLPLSILEALRNSMAVISTNVSGIPEIVDSSNGILIEPTIDCLVDVLSRLEKFDWVQMGLESRKKFEQHYNFKRMREDYLKMLNRC